MQPVRMNLSQDLRFGFGTIASQIKLNTRSGYTDLPKSQEKSLLGLINLAYDKKFTDMNDGRFNYPAIDYGDINSGIALQMTATVTKVKLQDTITKLQKHDQLKNYKEIWFFLLTVEAIPSTVKISANDLQIKYLTFNELVNKVLDSDIESQNNFIRLLKTEYPDYFQFNNKSFRITKNIPIPNSLSRFNDFIETNEWFPENPNEGYSAVYQLLESFRKRLSQCSKQARNILLTIMEIKGIPTTPNGVIKIYADELLGALNIDSDDEFDDFSYHFNFLEQNEIIEKYEEFQRMYTKNEEVYIENRIQFILRFHLWEPEINLFSVLPSFYERYHSYDDFEYAIENVDFSKLSD